MDGTPYPPPAPEVPPPGVQPQQYAAAPPPPKKSKTGLIIVIVVVVLLLCCCITSVGGYFAYKAAEESTTEVFDEVTTDLDSEDYSTDATTLDTGWDDFAPEPYDSTVYVGLEAFHQEVLDEVMATLYPDFELAEAVVRPSSEYTTDLVLARASLASDPSVQIAFYLEVENTEAYDSGWTNDPASQEFDYLDVATAANGREYFWDNTQLVPLMGGISDTSTEELLAQAATDFADGVVYLVENDGETATVEVTRWDAYPDYAGGFTAYYSYDGSTWTLDSAEEW